MKNENKYIGIAREIVLNLIDKENVTVFLFGSRAGNNFIHDSDIDIGFLSNNILDNKLFNRISESLEESLVPYHFDLIDFNKTDEAFKNSALKNIELWNKAKNISIN